MPSVRSHFESRAASLKEFASVDAVETADAVAVRLRPRNPLAVGVVLYVLADEVGTVALDDPACVPAELVGGTAAGIEWVDYFIDVAVEGRATAFHLGRGGCVEIRDGERTTRSCTTPGHGRVGDGGPSGSRTCLTRNGSLAHAADRSC
jgi:hypothetical protein